MSDKIVEEALEAFELASEAEADNRRDAKDDIEFARLGIQWPEKMRRERETAGRPCLTINKLQPIIRQVVNDSRQNRPSIKVHPCDSGSDPDTADVLGGIIRNIEARSNADVAYDTAIDSAVSGGFGYWIINTDYSLNAVSEQDILSAGPAAFEQDIFIRRVANPFSVYGDPHSTAADSSDWNQAHVVETMTSDEFKRKYKGAGETDFTGHKWMDVKAPWRDEDTVQVAAYWKREEVERKALMIQLGPDENGVDGEIITMFEDEFAKQRDLILQMGGQVIGAPRAVKSKKVCQYIVSGVEELEKKDWAGAYIPIVPVYGDEVNLEGRRHFRSLIRDSRDAQQMFNYWRTTETETIALAPRVPFILEEGAIPKGQANKWATANSHSHPYLLYTKGFNAPQRQPSPSVPAAMLQGALNASDDIKAITGLYDASMGARSNETSGRAIMARQREGDISTFHFIDNLTRAIRHSGVILLDLIPKVYSSERIVRILGEDGKPDKVRVNGDGGQQDEQGRMKDEAGLRIHDLRTGRYDVTVTAGPSFTSRREEAATQMIELIRAYPDAAPIIGDLLAKNLDWPGADEIADRLEKMLPPNLRDEEGQIPPEIQQQMQQMGEAIQQLGQQLQDATDKKDIDREKLKIEGFKAETERMTAMIPAFGPDEMRTVVMQVLAEIASDGLPSEEVAPTGLGSFEQPDMGQAA